MRLAYLSLLLLAVPLAGRDALAAQGGQDAAEDRKLRIGILYRADTDEGDSLLEGVRRALERWQSESDKPYEVVAEPLPYPTEERGYRELKRICDEGAVDLVIGPTDSGVFRDALTEQDAFARQELPVISPVVAADFEEQSEWLFKTNADVRARAESMLNLLRQRGARSVGVLYEGTEFGLSSEEAFRDLSGELDWYQAARFSDEADLSRAIDIFLDARPAAIGILSSRKNTEWVHETIAAKNYGFNPYRPYVFSIIDLRSKEILGLDFVSVGTLEDDETTVLTETTMQQVCAVLDNVEASFGTDGWAEDVKDGLAGVLDRSPQGVTGKRHLFSWRRDGDGREGRVVDLAEVEAPTFLRRMLQGPTVLLRRFGVLPVVNLLIVAVLVLVLTGKDLRKWNDERELDRRTRRAMTKVVVFNVAVALIVFLFMISSGALEWWSTTGAIVVGFGYPALLKTTIGQTKTGRSIGVAEFYDDYLRRLNDEIMKAKYHERKQIVDFIAMTNSLPRMRDTLLKLYDCNSPSRRLELTQGLDAELGEATDSLGRRMAYAKRIYRTHSWDELVSSKFAPPIDQEDLVGPEEILQAAVEYCDHSRSITLSSIRADFDKRIAEKAETGPERAEADRAEVEEWLGYAQTEAGEMRCYLRWLFIQVRFRIARIVGLGYLPRSVQEWGKEEWDDYSGRAAEATGREWAAPEGGGGEPGPLEDEAPLGEDADWEQPPSADQLTPSPPRGAVGKVVD